jgi:hypothetical protein
MALMTKSKELGYKNNLLLSFFLSFFFQQAS